MALAAAIMPIPVRSVGRLPHLSTTRKATTSAITPAIWTKPVAMIAPVGLVTPTSWMIVGL